MAMKFKCKDCRHSFELKNGDEEVCPNCKSDNIQPAGTAMSIIGKFSLFLGMAAVGYFVTTLVLDTTDEKISGGQTAQNKELSHETELPENVVADAENTDTTTPVEPLEPIDSAEFTVSNITLKQDGFSFFVQCGKIPVDYQVELYQLFLNENDVEPMLTADASGEFKSSKYLANDGKYFVKAIFINNNTTTLKPIEGIVKPATPAEVVKPKKMEKAELESKINKSLVSRNKEDNKWYKPSSGGREVALNVQVTLRTDNGTEVYEGVPINDLKAVRIKKVKVIDVTYDDNNIITSFVISPFK